MPADPKKVNYKGVMLCLGRANHKSMSRSYVKNCILQVISLNKNRCQCIKEFIQSIDNFISLLKNHN